MSELYYNKYSKIIKNSNLYNICEINNTIDQCHKFLLLIYNYLKTCFKLLIKISLPTLNKYDYKSCCDEIRLYVREIDNIVQTAQYNTRQILISSKNKESAKEIIFNIMPFGYSFTFEVPVVDTIALCIEEFKIDWKYKHACITALAATEPNNINRNDKSILLLKTYDLSRQLIENADMQLYSNYGIDKNNITSAIIKINKDFEFDDYNFINLYIPKKSDENNSFVLYDKQTHTNYLNYLNKFNNLYSRYILDRNPLYLTYISLETNAQLDFSSLDLLDTSLKFPFELKNLEIDTVDEIEKYLYKNLYKFKNKFSKAMKLIELEIKKMIHYKNIIIPIQNKILNIHKNGYNNYKKKQKIGNSDLVNISKFNLKRKILSKRVYEDRKILEFKPCFILINKASRGDKLHTLKKNKFKYNLEPLNLVNRRDTYNKDNCFKIIYQNNIVNNIIYNDKNPHNIIIE